MNDDDDGDANIVEAVEVVEYWESNCY